MSNQQRILSKAEMSDQPEPYNDETRHLNDLRHLAAAAHRLTEELPDGWNVTPDGGDYFLVCSHRSGFKSLQVRLPVPRRAVCTLDSLIRGLIQDFIALLTTRVIEVAVDDGERGYDNAAQPADSSDALRENP